MGGNSVSPGDLARIRLFMALIAAEKVAVAVVILPAWTPFRAAVAGLGLAFTGARAATAGRWGSGGRSRR